MVVQTLVNRVSSKTVSQGCTEKPGLKNKSINNQKKKKQLN